MIHSRSSVYAEISFGVPTVRYNTRTYGPELGDFQGYSSVVSTWKLVGLKCAASARVAITIGFASILRDKFITFGLHGIVTCHS